MTVGVKVFQSDKPESILPTLGDYDVITFWHNIEHLLEPWKVLEEACKKELTQEGSYINRNSQSRIVCI